MKLQSMVTSSKSVSVKTRCEFCGSRDLSKDGECWDCRQHDELLPLAKRLGEAAKQCREAYLWKPASPTGSELAHIKVRLEELTQKVAEMIGGQDGPSNRIHPRRR